MISDNVCQLTEDTEFEKYYVSIKDTILNEFSSNSTDLAFKKKWWSSYLPGTVTEFHNHHNTEFLATGNHVIIQILETGAVDENITILDENQNKIVVPVTSGDALIFPCTTFHGMETTIEKLYFVVFAITL
jgi:uncharacterized protein YjlB